MEGPFKKYLSYSSEADLIDLNCSQSNRANDVLPLIPCPKSSEIITNSNPFDSVAVEAELNAYDPFELVYNTALGTTIKQSSVPKMENSSTKNSVVSLDSDKNDISKTSCAGNLESHINLSNPACNSNLHDKSDIKAELLKDVHLEMVILSKDNRSRTSLNTSDEEVIRSSASERIQRSLDNSAGEKHLTDEEQASNSLEMNSFRSSLPVSFKENVHDCTKSSSLSSIDMTSEETVKATVQKRINKIQKKVIRSFNGSLPSLSVKNSGDLNKAFCFSSSSEKSNVPASFSTSKDMGVSSSDIEDDVFLEAKKLSESFTTVKPSFIRMNLNDEPEDLRLVEPPELDPANSSDEEMEKLRNDPSLNLKFNLSLEQLPAPKKAVEFSDVVMEYTKRRSLNLNSSLSTNCSSPSVQVPEVALMKRSHSFGGTDSRNEETKKLENKKIIAPPVFITDALLKKQPEVAHPAQEEFSLKLKKPQLVVNKKGPLKAVIPLQKMTRPDVIKRPKRNDSPKQKINHHPSRASHSRYSSPSRRGFSSKPVASSTPNKNSFVGQSPATSPILKTNKSTKQLYQSLDSSENLPNLKGRSSSLSSTPNVNEDTIDSQKKLSRSGTELKKNLKLSRLPRIKPKSALNSHNGNQTSKPSLLPQPFAIDSVDKIRTKLSNNYNRHPLPADKENISLF